MDFLFCPYSLLPATCLTWKLLFQRYLRNIFAIHGFYISFMESAFWRWKLSFQRFWFVHDYSSVFIEFSTMFWNFTWFSLILHGFHWIFEIHDVQTINCGCNAWVIMTISKCRSSYTQCLVSGLFKIGLWFILDFFGEFRFGLMFPWSLFTVFWGFVQGWIRG